ncbi:MAG TPA: preprotein translocase subunit YajC [Acidimicrobiales bacterium]|nr:preprotein translocase subunit YajC [Acidimicrobiales bacterium]
MMMTTAFFGALLEGAAKNSKPTTSGSSIGTLLFMVVLFGLVYVFFLRPRSQAARRQRDTLMELSAGDEVLTGAGIYGTVLDVADDRVTLETAPGTRITVVRSTIARRIVEQNANSVDEQNRHDEGHDGVAEAAGWHDPSERDIAAATRDHSTDNGSDGDHGAGDQEHGSNEKPEADGAPGAAKEGGR